MKKFSLLLILIFNIFVIPSNSQINKYFGSSKVSLDESGVINFLRYLDGTFHSEDVVFNRAAKIMSPMFYAISDDGKVGYGWFCHSHLSNACADDFVSYRLIEYCKEYTRTNCSIFAYKNEIVWNNINVKIKDLKFNENVKLFKELNLYNSNSSNKITEDNYLNYLHLDLDKCTSNKNATDYKNLRGSSIDCLLPGRYELTTNERSGGSNFD